MGLLDKIKFWKKDELDDFSDLGDFGMGDDKKDIAKPEPTGVPEASDLGETTPKTSAKETPVTPSFEENVPEGLPRPRSFEESPSMPSTAEKPSQYPSYQQPLQHAPLTQDSKDLELISAKLDAMRATLESMNQRLANLERIAQGEQQQKRRE